MSLRPEFKVSCQFLESLKKNFFPFNRLPLTSKASIRVKTTSPSFVGNTKQRYRSIDRSNTTLKKKSGGQHSLKGWLIAEMSKAVDDLPSSLQKLLSVSGNKNDSGDESGEDVKVVGVAPAAASSYDLSPSQIEFYQVCGCGEEKDVCGTCGLGCQIKQ